MPRHGLGQTKSKRPGSQPPRGALLLLSAALFLILCSEALAEDRFIQAGKFKVHPTRLLAKFADGAGLQSSAKVLSSVGLAIKTQYTVVPGLVLLDAQPVAGPLQKLALSEPKDPADILMKRIQALEDSGLFTYVQPSYAYTNLLTPNDASFSDNTLWGLRNTGARGGLAGADIGVEKAWDLTTGSTNVIVAVVDTGIRYTHQELVRQMWRNPGEIAGNRIDDDGDGFIDNVFGLNAVTRSGDPMDDNDHGTHVAGTIGAAANDGNPHVGVAWNVSLMACKFLAGDGFGTSDDAISCLEFAVENGARIINASWGGGPFERALLDTLTAARRQGVLFVAAAGNDSANNDTTEFYPASYRLDNVVAVAALDRRDRLATFSNFGATTVHLGAPGDSIYSLIAANDSAYDTLDGTSMAAPHVAGVAALILAKFPTATLSEVRERLLSTTVEISGLAGKVARGGRLNAYRALSATPDGTLELGLDPPEWSDLSARRPVPFYVTVTDLSAVTNAVVRARVQDASEDVILRNDGTAPDFEALDEIYSAELTLPTTPGPFTILITVSAPDKTNVTRAVNYIVASPPLNDNFADALELPSQGALLQWTNRFATIETGEPKHARSPSASSSVWWNWVPASSGPVIIDTAGSSIDTVVAVYTNSLLTALREVASADDAGNKKQGRVIFDARAGVTYRVAVAGFAVPDTGMIRLRLEPGGGPDTAPPVVTITGPASGLTITNATDAKVLIEGTALDPAPNMSGVRQVQVQVNRNLASTAAGTTNWSSTVLLEEGQNRIKVSATDYSGNASPIRSITVTYDPLLSPNDLLSAALELAPTNGTATGNSTRASKEASEPQHAGNPGGKSIWWRFAPAQDGVLTLSTANSTFNTLLAVYSAKITRMSSLELLSSNDDAAPGSEFSQLTQVVKAGDVYLIAVDGVAGSSGLVQLDYAFRAATVYQLTITTTDGGSVSPGSGYYEAGSSVALTATPRPFHYFEGWAGAISSLENPLQLAIHGDMEITPRFLPIEYSDGFESGALAKLEWKTSGTLPWIVQTEITQAGQFAARSGEINNGQRSSLLLTGVFREGTGSFGLRVSSEATWDPLEFYLNGRRLNRWSGEVGWTNYQFAMPPGSNTLEWRYVKDFLNTSAGLDAAFIDNVDLPFVIPSDSSTPARLEISRAPDGGVQLTVTGQRNQVYVIQSCGDFVDWSSILTNTAHHGVIRWVAPASNSPSKTFYRAVVP